MSPKFLQRTLLTFLASTLALVPVTSTLAGPVGPGGRIGDDKPAGAPILGLDAPNVIPGRYIVVFSERGEAVGETNGVARSQKAEAMNVAVGLGAEVHFDYNGALS